MAITPQHQKGEPEEADLEKAYNRARSIGLFLVEKMARQYLKDHPACEAFEIDDSGLWSFRTREGEDRFISSGPLHDFIEKWDDTLDLTGEPMRFTATGPVRREW